MDKNKKTAKQMVEDSMAERRATIKVREMIEKIMDSTTLTPALKQAHEVMKSVEKIERNTFVFTSYAMVATDDEETPDFSEFAEYLNLVLSGLETFIGQHPELAPYVL